MHRPMFISARQCLLTSSIGLYHYTSLLRIQHYNLHTVYIAKHNRTTCIYLYVMLPSMSVFEECESATTLELRRYHATTAD